MTEASDIVVGKLYIVVSMEVVVQLFCTSCAEIRNITMNRLITIDTMKYTMQPAGGGSLNRIILHLLRITYEL